MIPVVDGADIVDVNVGAGETAAKRAKRSLLATHKDRRVARKYAAEFREEGLEERDEMLFCTYCNRNVPFDTKAAVRQHYVGQRSSEKSKPGAEKLSKHQRKKAAAQAASDKKNALTQAIEKQRNVMFDNVAKPVGASLPASMQADRVETLETLWHCGIPVNAVREPRFLALIEEPHQALGGVEGLRALIPFAKQRASEHVRDSLRGRHVAVFVDGTKVNILSEGVIARFVDDLQQIRQICIGMAAITKSVNAAMLIALLRKHMSDAGLELKNVVGVMSDSGQPNPAALKQWNDTSHDAGLSEEALLWIPCVMHAASNVGLTMRMLLAPVKQFMSGFKTMSNESDAARVLWQEKTGRACKQLSDKSFWRWWDCIREVLKVTEHIAGFIREATARKLSKKSVAKMAEAWKNQLLVPSMQFCIAAGQVFRDMGVMLEGDGFCLPLVYKHIRLAEAFYAAWPRANRASAFQHHLIAPIFNAVREKRPNDASVAALPGILYDVGVAVAAHADSAILTGMASLLPLYRAGSLFHPLMFLAEAERPEFSGTYLPAAIEIVVSLKGVAVEDRLQLKIDLNAQILSYQNECRDRARHLQAVPKADTAVELWKWWVSLSATVPAWFSIAKILVLLQPTSAAIERFFSLVKANTSPLQNNETADNFTARCMYLYNHVSQ